MAEFTFGPVGAVHRGNIRDAARRYDISLTEMGSWIESHFHVTGSAAGLNGFRAFLDAYVARNTMLDAECSADEAAFNAAWRWWNPRTWSGLAQAFGLWLALMAGIPGFFVAILMACGVEG